MVEGKTMRTAKFARLGIIAWGMFSALVPVRLNAQEARAELRLIPETRVEKLAGVWVDGEYLGYVDQFKGRNTLGLVAGKHKMVIRVKGMKDMKRELNLAPGGALDLMVKLEEPEADLPPEGGSAALKIMVAPDSAAVFVDGVFEGPAVQFGGIGRTLRLAPGKHVVKITQSGYLDYVTNVELEANQRQTIENRLDPAPAGSQD
jgi:hypothetical protein